MFILVFYFCYAGCFCVYNSLRGLEYIQESLEKTLLSDVREDRLPFQGLPVGVVLAHDPSHTEKDLMILRDGGQSLADRYYQYMRILLVHSRKHEKTHAQKSLNSHHLLSTAPLCRC